MVLLTCGGTITMAPGDDGILRPGKPADMVALVERIARSPVILVEVDNIDSGDTTPSHWSRVRTALRDAMAAHPNGRFIVTHGTDTLAWTAGMLAVSGPWDHPVVVTGANIPLGLDASDAPLNLRGALIAAAACDSGAWISFAAPHSSRCHIFQAGYARKLPAEDGTFIGLPTAHAVLDGERLVHLHRARPVPWRAPDGDFRRRRALVLVANPAMEFNPHLADAQGARPDIVILQLYGSATVPPGAIRFAHQCCDVGVPVWACPPSPVAAMPYESTARLRESGTLLFPTATVELLLPLACAGFCPLPPPAASTTAGSPSHAPSTCTRQLEAPFPR